MLTDDWFYNIRQNSRCSPKRENITILSLSLAKLQCTNDPSCAIVYDVAGLGKTFRLCDEGAKIITSSTGSLLHIKAGESLCMSTPFFNVSIPNIAICKYALHVVLSKMI